MSKTSHRGVQNIVNKAVSSGRRHATEELMPKIICLEKLVKAQEELLEIGDVMFTWEDGYRVETLRNEIKNLKNDIANININLRSQEQ